MARKTDAQIERLTEEIRALSGRVAKLQGKEDYLDEKVKLTDRVILLKNQIEDLEISKLRVIEEQEKEKRETRHMVGLERKRQEFEAEQELSKIEVAKREALIEVREENLIAEREAFEVSMQFITKRFTEENQYVRDIMESILARLPDVSVALNTSRPSKKGK